MAVLDLLLVKEYINVTETVNTNFTTISHDITFKQDAFSIQFTYNNGSSVNMEVYLEVSSDGVNYAKIEDSSTIITDTEGGVIWDLKDSGTNNMRIAFEVTSGSIDITNAAIYMRRNH